MPRLLRYQSPTNPYFGRSAANFAVIGAVCTVAFAILYAAFRQAAPPAQSNVLALSLTMVLNFFANRRFTFPGAEGSFLFQFAGYFAAYVAGLIASTAVLDALIGLAGSPSPVIEMSMAVASGFVATAVRFALLSTLVFRRKRPSSPRSTTAVEQPVTQAASGG